MPYKVTTDDGEEIEAFSQEEVEALANERLAAEAERIESEKQAEVDRLAQEKLDLESELEKLKNKDMNFERVRKKAEGKDVEISEEIKSQISQLEERINAIAAQPKEDVKQDFVKQYIGDNKEQQERFDYYFEKLGSDAVTKEDVIKASQEALRLASDGEYKPDLSSGMYNTGVNQNYRGTQKNEVSETSKEIGALLGVTEEDRKKYGNK